MIKRYGHSRAGIKHKAIINMLDGSLNPLALKRWKDFFNDDHGIEYRNGTIDFDEHFTYQALLAGKEVVVYQPNQWLFYNHGKDNCDFLVLKFTGNLLHYFTTRLGGNGEQSYHDSFPVTKLDLYNITLHGILLNIVERSSISKVPDYDEQETYVLALDKEFHYVPEYLRLLDDEFTSEGELLSLGVPNLIKTTGRYNVVDDSPVNHANETKPNSEENKLMSTVKTNATNVLAKNKSAAASVAKLEAGRIGIKQVSKLIVPKLPMLVRGYADTEIGRLVIANLFNFVVTQYAGNNRNAVLVADAMLEGAMLEALQSINLEKLIADVVSGVDITKLTSVDE